MPNKYSKIFLFFSLIYFLLPGRASALTVSKTPTTPPTLKTGLVGWWTMDGMDVTVTTTTDKSGRGNDGTRTATKIVTGKIGQAMYFNGSTSFITLPTTASLNITSNITMSAWVKTSATGITSIINGYNSSPFPGYGFYVNYPTTGKTGYFSGTSMTWVGSSSTINNGKWHQIAVSVSGTTATFYTDGAFDGQQTSAQPNSFSGSRFIGEYRDGTYKLNGSLDDVRIYSRALSASEVQQLYKLGGGKINKTPTAPPTLKTGLVGWWTMDGADVSATTVTDKSGNGKDGTRTGGTSLIAGKLGQAMKFDGSSGNVALPATGSHVTRGNLGFASNENFSLSVWYKGTDIAQNSEWGHGLISWNSTNIYSVFALRSGYAEYIHYANAAWNHNIKSSTLVADGKWHNILFINYSDNTGSLYVDGVREVNRADSTINSGGTYFQPYTIGLGYDNVSTNGGFDDVRIYNRALSASEVEQLYKLGGGKINKTPSAPPTLKTGLVGLWTFDGMDVTATNAIDKSGSGNNGTRAGGTSLTTGKLGQAMRFDGTSGYINIDGAATASNAKGTISSWVKFSTSTATRVISAFSNVSSINYFFLALNTTNGLRASAYKDSTQKFDLSTTAAIPLNTWVHVAVVQDGMTPVLYVNGVAEAQSFSTSVDTTIWFGSYIGGTLTKGRIGDISSSGESTFFPDTIDDVRIYSRALSAQEVMQLYKMGK